MNIRALPRSVWFFPGLAGIWALLAIAIAVCDASWNAMAVFVIYGPAVNAAIGVAGVLYLAGRSALHPDAPIGLVSLIVLISPMISLVLIECAALFIQLHGC